MCISTLSLCFRSTGKGQGELWVLSTVPWQVLSWCLAGAQTCPLGRSKARRRCRMTQAAQAQHGEDMVWEEQQPRPCLESSPKAAEPCRLRWDKLLLSWRGALWSVGKQHVPRAGVPRDPQSAHSWWQEDSRAAGKVMPPCCPPVAPRGPLVLLCSLGRVCECLCSSSHEHYPSLSWTLAGGCHPCWSTALSWVKQHVTPGHFSH